MKYTSDGEAGRVPGSRIHNRVKVLRVERGLSRKQLAEGLGVNYQTVGYIERGEYNPSLELAFRASEFFGLPIEAVFSRRPFRPLSEEVYGIPGATDRAGEGDEATEKGLPR
jgi:DNA-binding XRE family transcriptional regulator